MGDGEQLLAVVDGLYDALIDDVRWDDALGAVRGAFGASGALLIVSNREDMHPVFGRISGIDPASWPEYVDHYHSQDLWMEQALRLPPRSVVTGGEIVTRDRLKHSEWYNDFLLRYGIEELLACVPETTASLIGVLSIFRPVGAEPFTVRDKKRLLGIRKHLDRVMKLRLKLAETDNALAAQSDAQDMLPFGIFFLDASPRVVRANRAGREMLLRQDGLRALGGHLGAAHRDDRARLDRLIAEAVDFNPLAASRTDGTLAVRRPSGKRPYSLLVMPVSPRCRATGLLGRAAVSAIVFVTDPEACIEIAEADLSCFFGLTPAEARLASEMATGDGLDAIAERLVVTRETARTMLKRVYAKTDTHRQAELVRLILSVPSIYETPD